MKKILLLLFILSSLFSANAFAQYCTPLTTNYCCGYGITRVIFNTIDNISADGSTGFQNFSSQQTSVLIGQNYSLSVKVDVPGEHNVKAWIDWNNDKIFDEVNEEVLSATEVLSINSSVYIPSNALLNIPLRLRISADYSSGNIIQPCNSLYRGQAEDYSILVVQNPNAPVASFIAENTVSCTGDVQFTDKSTNLPTQWLWDFGDSATSTIQNPMHFYNSSGIFSVTMIAFNNNGSDTLIKSNYVSINTENLPVQTSCTPNTTAICCGYGIYSVTFNAISNTSAGATDSYQDYSCTKNTSVTEGVVYNLQVTTGPSEPEDLRVWLDFNNDGILDDVSEKIFTSLSAYTHSGNITIPLNSINGVALRMRIISESTGNSVSSCTDPLFGQAEDYGVTVINVTGNQTAGLIPVCGACTIFPNPNNGKFSIPGLRTNSQITISDLAGKKLFEINARKGQKDFDLPLQPGIYFLIIQGDDFSVQKIIIE